MTTTNESKGILLLLTNIMEVEKEAIRTIIIFTT